MTHIAIWKREPEAAIKAALAPDGGHSWEKRLRDAGYHVFQAV